MSIVGTRPPLISETNLYEPRHEIVKQMYKFDISVVITFPGIPKSQKKYGLSACILSENEKQAIAVSIYLVQNTTRGQTP